LNDKIRLRRKDEWAGTVQTKRKKNVKMWRCGNVKMGGCRDAEGWANQLATTLNVQ
jgi:hypothetical protein